MTVVVAFYCTDGVVVASDSMLTPSMGGIPIGHRKGKKIHILPTSQIFAFAGDQGLSVRFSVCAEQAYNRVTKTHASDYPLALSAIALAQFESTGIVGNAVNLNAVIAYDHNNIHQCYIFEGMLQPRPLDNNHYYAVLGSGMLGGDPFLRFLVDIFCPTSAPTVREAIFLSTWAVQHVIETNPGGVAGPIKIAVFERDATSQLKARELPDNEIEEHKQAVESACKSLRKWREDIQSGEAADGIAEPPNAPNGSMI